MSLPKSTISLFPLSFLPLPRFPPLPPHAPSPSHSPYSLFPQSPKPTTTTTPPTHSLSSLSHYPSLPPSLPSPPHHRLVSIPPSSPTHDTNTSAEMEGLCIEIREGQGEEEAREGNSKKLAGWLGCRWSRGGERSSFCLVWSG